MLKIELEYILVFAKKIKAINYLGGKCEFCGESNFVKMDFHHTNGRDDKDETLAIMFRSNRWTVIEKELKKCKLLCGNCHQKLHADERINGDNKGTINKGVYIEFKGISHCERCGYSKSLGALTFHHKDPSEKLFQLSNMFRRFYSVIDLSDDIKEELNKCIVLCRNCHVEEHFNKEKFEKYKEYIYKKTNDYIEKPSKYDRNLIIKLKNEGMRNMDIAKNIGCSKGTITKCLKERD